MWEYQHFIAMSDITAATSAAISPTVAVNIASQGDCLQGNWTLNGGALNIFMQDICWKSRSFIWGIMNPERLSNGWLWRHLHFSPCHGGIFS